MCEGPKPRACHGGASVRELVIHRNGGSGVHSGRRGGRRRRSSSTSKSQRQRRRAHRASGARGSGVRGRSGSRHARSRSRHVTSRGSGNEDRSRGVPPFTVAAAVPGKGARKSRQTTVSVRSLVRPSGAFRVVVPRCCSCALCCWGLLFRPCAGGATFLLGQARASVDAHLTSPHLTRLREPKP